MRYGERPTTRPTSTRGVAALAGTGPLPLPELLLRDGSGAVPVPEDPRTILSADAGRLLVIARPRADSRLLTAAFQRQVAAIRRHLTPVVSTDVLAASFDREAFRGHRLGHVRAIEASPVRVAYAIRWVELQLGIRLPPLEAWFEPPTAA